MKIVRTLGVAAALALAAVAAHADPAPDPQNTITLHDENSSVSIGGLSDRYYVNGLFLGWTSPSDKGSPLLKDLDHRIWGPGQTRVEFSLEQQIWTPADSREVIPQPGDRPYAGVLMANLSLLDDTDTTRSVIALSAGLIGPDAGGEQIQNGFHDIIGQAHVNGWGTQIRNDPAVNLLAGRTWRSKAMPIGGDYEVDWLGNVTGAVGDLRDYALAGGSVRIGKGLDSDFGAPRLAPGLSGEDAYLRNRPLAWYAYAGLDGQLVGYDLTLQASPFRSGQAVPIDPVVGEGQIGLVVLYGPARVAFSYVAQTYEFHGQQNGLHEFFSAALATKF
ncbi:MAG TPA: lipid A deacylase LpxR family protein [Caulobacteraceae bacterium]